MSKSAVKAKVRKKVLPPEKPNQIIDTDKTYSLNDVFDPPTKMPSVSSIPNKDEEVNAIYRDDSEITAFDGISNKQEHEELYSQAAEYERKKAKVIEEELRRMEQQREQERLALEKEIRKLKQELHRTVPIQDNKFFSLSKQLRDAVVEIQQLATEEGISLETVAVPAPLVAPSVAQPVAAPTAVVETPKIKIETPKTVQIPVEETNNDKKKLPKNKLLITGASAVAVLVLIGSLTTKTIIKKPEIDQKLVDNYLSQSGSVKGTSTTGSSTQADSSENDPSQADVTFEQSVWQELNDTGFGVMLQYPKNSVRVVHTDSNITFIRKTGYLFKIQRIETALTLQEYWKQIKATSLNYTVKEEKFKGRAALKLELEDMADYPGDRILVKEGNFIYDVWYATPSNAFSKDDISRSEKMLASLSIVGAK